MATKEAISVRDDDKWVWEKALEKAAPISRSRVIIQLLKMWLTGKIEIDWTL